MRALESADTVVIGPSLIRRLTLWAGPIAAAATAAGLLLVVGPMLGFRAWPGVRTAHGRGMIELPATVAARHPGIVSQAGLSFPALGGVPIAVAGTRLSFVSSIPSPPQGARRGPGLGALSPVLSPFSVSPFSVSPSPVSPVAPGVAPSPVVVTTTGAVPGSAPEGTPSPASPPAAGVVTTAPSSSPVAASSPQAGPTTAERAAALTARNASDAAALTARNASDAAALTARNASDAAALTASQT